jgi:hypothetical protein
VGAGCVANVFQRGELGCGESCLQQVDVIGHVWFAGSERVERGQNSKSGAAKCGACRQLTSDESKI